MLFLAIRADDHTLAVKADTIAFFKPGDFICREEIARPETGDEDNQQNSRAHGI